MKTQKITGIVEGFFSRPLPRWTMQERKKIIELFAKSNTCNFYLYCPKQDPYVVSSWNKLYPENILSDLKAIIDICDKSGIDFCYGFNPSFNIIRTSKKFEEYFSVISEKIDQLLSIGCRNIALLYDDIPQLYMMENQERIHNEIIIARQLIKTANDTQIRYKKKINKLLFCFYDYYFKNETLLTKEIKKSLNPDVYIVWTGGNRFVKKISVGKYDKVKKTIGDDKKIIVWCNYPSNNCEHNLGVFHLDPFNKPDQKVFDNVEGYMVNPMREAYANIPIIKSYMNYLEYPSKYKNINYKKIFQDMFGSKWQAYYYIIREFSYPNITVKNKFLIRYFKKSLFSKTIEKYSAYLRQIKRDNQNEFEYFTILFINSVKLLFDEANAYINLLSKVLCSERISYDEFIKSDRFPTYSKRAGYLDEIYSIVKKRILQYSNKLSITKYQNIDRIIAYIRMYKGSFKLKMKKQDIKKIIQLNEDLINWERKFFFVSVMQNSALKPKDKIYEMAKRKNITRYSL